MTVLSFLRKGVIRDYSLILIGSIIYAISTALFIFPPSLLLGGTSGISVILERFLPFSPGTILMVINFSLIILAFIILGKEMAFKTLVGSSLTALFIGLFEKIFSIEHPIINSLPISAILGALLIAFASAIMFYVGSSSGGTDVVALIIKKFLSIHIGKALLISDILIVLSGGAIGGIKILICSLLGLLIKTFGIDFFINLINKLKAKQ